MPQTTESVQIYSVQSQTSKIGLLLLLKSSTEVTIILTEWFLYLDNLIKFKFDNIMITKVHLYGNAKGQKNTSWKVDPPGETQALRDLSHRIRKIKQPRDTTTAIATNMTF